MQEYKTIKSLNFLCGYFLVLTLLTSYICWFDGSSTSLLLLLIFLGGGYLFVQIFFVGKRIESLEEKAPEWHIYAFVIVGIAGTPEIYTTGYSINSFVCFLFYMAAFFCYLLWKYYNGRNMVLCQNPSVTENTKKRIGKKMQKTMFRILFLTALLCGPLLFAVTVLPTLEIGRMEISHEKEKEKGKRAPASTVRNEKDISLHSEERKIPEVAALILKYFLWGLAIVICVVTVIFLVYQLMKWLQHMGNGETEYEEVMVEKNDNEEYMRLVPVKRKAKEFSKDNNGKVRQAFYHIIKEQAEDSKIDMSMTPWELESRYLRKVSSHEEITFLYEKARYGEVPITDKEIEKAGL